MALKLADRASGRDNNFNLVRMIAATSVLVSHSYPLAVDAQALEPLESLLTQDHIHDNLGRLAVFAFFGISGFFITRSYCQRRSLRAFLQARALRLFPALVPMSLFTFVAVALWGSDAPFGAMVKALPAYFFEIMTLDLPRLFGIVNIRASLPGVFESNPLSAVNGSLWTLPFEVMCYGLVVIAGFLGLFRRIVFFLPAFAVVLVAYAVVFHFVPGRSFVPETLLYLGVPFAIGAAFWVLRDHVVLSPVLTFGFVAGAALFSGTLLFRPMLCLALVHGIFVLGYARLPGLDRYNRIGDYSYGTYIYAFPIQQVLVAQGVTGAGMNVMAALPLTLLCAVLSWHYVEKPMLRLAHRGRGDQGTRL